MDLGLEGQFAAFKDCINERIHPTWVRNSLSKKTVMLPKTRFETVFANDIKESAAVAWDHNFRKRRGNAGVFRTESIVDLVKAAWNGHTIFPKKIDLVTGGFPCQDFSNAGKRNGFKSHRQHDGALSQESTATEENRGLLYIWMKHVINQVKPKMFIAENVQALTTIDNALDTIQSDFADVGGGYFVQSKVLNAAEYGIPQTRRRVFFIGFKKSSLRKGVLQKLRENDEQLSPYPPVTHFLPETKTPPTALKKYVAVKKVLSGLHEPEAEMFDLSQKSLSRAKFYGKHCQGNVELDLQKPSYTIRAEHHGNIEFRRLSQKNGGSIKGELDKGLQERRLTVRECARIQTFPDDFDFVIDNPNGRKMLLNGTEGYVVVGNAVPPLLAYHFAHRIESKWDLYFK